jgi:hypothetical protein
MSWAASLIATAVFFLMLCGVGVMVSELVKRYRKQQRRNKRLYGYGNVYSLRDFK